MSGPYAEAVHAYRQAGWRGTLPLPNAAKKPVPDGYTGADGIDPSGPDIQAWLDDGVTVGRGHWPAGNIALRLPADVIGIDVDDYGLKQGATTLARLTAECGPLPPTWRTSSRDDGVSGIYLFRVPEGLAWPGIAGPGIEVIQRRHRYAVVWPSIHPDTGRLYEWRHPYVEPVAIRPDREPLYPLPKPQDLPELPAGWVGHLTRGELAVDHARAGTTDLEAVAWVNGQLDPACRAMAAVCREHLEQLTAATGEARHDLAVKASQALVHLAAEGHTGLSQALGTYRQSWTAKLAAEGRNRTDDIHGEWTRMTTGAVRVALAAHPIAADLDPCLDPFAGLVPAGTLARAQIASRRGPADVTPAGPPATSTQWWAAGSTVDDTGPVTADAPGGPSERSLAPSTASGPGEASDLEVMRAAATRQAYERLRATRDARQLLDDETALATFTPPAYTIDLAAELDIPDDAEQYRIDQLMPAGANVLLTASFKAGKTTLVNHLAQTLVDGGKFLDQWAVHRDPGDVVALWNYEVAPGMYRRWLRDQDIKATNRVVILNLRGKRMPLQVDHVAQWAAEWLEKHSVTTWIVDPFAAAFKGENENNNSEVGRFLDALDVIKDNAGVRELVMPAHTGRAVAEEGQERVRGASRLDDWTDIRWLLTIDIKDGQTERYFRATGRDVDIAEVRLSYDEAARRPFVNGPSRHAQRRDAYDFDVLAAVRINPGISSTQLRAEVRRTRGSSSNTEVDKTVARLIDLGRIAVRKDPDDARQTARHYLDDGISALIAPHPAPAQNGAQPTPDTLPL